MNDNSPQLGRTAIKSKSVEIRLNSRTVVYSLYFYFSYFIFPGGRLLGGKAFRPDKDKI